MGTYSIKNIDDLVKKMRLYPREANKSLANTLNRTGTFTISSYVDALSGEKTLKPDYIRKHIKVVARAKHSNLRTKIHANDRRTLLSRYTHSGANGDIRVKVNQGSAKRLKGAHYVNLRSGNGKGIAMRNKDFYRYLLTDGSTSSIGREFKKSKALHRKISKPYGWTVLHAPSINQMFRTYYDRLKPTLSRFMVKEFLEQFRRRF